MNISVELTLLPLKNEYIPPIKRFIKHLKDSGFTVMENPLSTHIYGEYDALMSFLNDEVKAIFEAQESVMLLMKLVKGDRSGYVSDI